MKNRWLISIMLLIPLIGLNYCGNKKEGKSKAASAPPENSGVVATLPGISIHEAALNGQLTDVDALMKAGIKTDTIDKDGRTPLIYASFNGHTEIISILIRNGADINIADNYGRTALMMASSGPYPMAVKMLLEQNADPDLVDREEHFTALMFAAAEGQSEVVKILLAYKADPNLKDIDGDDALTFARNNGHKAVVTLLESIKKQVP